MRAAFETGRRWVLAAAVAAALGFGGAQALASPGTPEEARRCNDEQCRRMCRAQGFINGGCIGDRCACAF